METVFLAILYHLGVTAFAASLNPFCILCREPGHWDWLTRDAEVLDYLSFVWQLLSLFEAGLSLVMMVVAATGYRRAERWAWYLLWLWLPVLIGEIVLTPWAWFMLVPLSVIVVVGQLWARKLFFRGEYE